MFSERKMGTPARLMATKSGKSAQPTIKATSPHEMGRNDPDRAVPDHCSMAPSLFVQEGDWAQRVVMRPDCGGIKQSEIISRNNAPLAKS